MIQQLVFCRVVDLPYGDNKGEISNTITVDFFSLRALDVSPSLQKETLKGPLIIYIKLVVKLRGRQNNILYVSRQLKNLRCSIQK